MTAETMLPNRPPLLAPALPAKGLKDLQRFFPEVRRSVSLELSKS